MMASYFKDKLIITSDLPIISEMLDEKSAIFCPPDDVDA